MINLKRQDIQKASILLADAFQKDPLLNKLYEGKSDLDRKFRNFFEIPIRYCLKYGSVWSTDGLEGIACWLPGKLSYMNFWRMLSSGAVLPSIRMGSKVAKTMQEAFISVDASRKTCANNEDYIYLFVLGVSTEHQGKGFGGKLLRNLISLSSKQKVPIYLETETEDNVKFYENRGFKVYKKLDLPVLKLPLWMMVKEAD